MQSNFCTFNLEMNTRSKTQKKKSLRLCIISIVVLLFWAAFFFKSQERERDKALGAPSTTGCKLANNAN